MRARGQSRRSKTFADPPAAGRSRKPKANPCRVLLMAPSIDSEESTLTSKGPSRDAGVHYLEYPDESIPTSELPTTGSSQHYEELLTMGGRRSAYRLALGPLQAFFPQGTPRGVDNRVAAHTQFAARPLREGLICYAWYGRHSISMERNLAVKEFRKIMENYESLQEE